MDTRRGYALILALSVVGIATALLLALLGVAGSAANAAAAARNRAFARQYALFALDSALAQLQEAAGPDTRITATALPGAENPRYVGIWEANATGPEPMTWLTSGAPESNSSVELVGLHTSGKADDVRAPLAGGNFSWWIGDQGVKAALEDRYDRHGRDQQQIAGGALATLGSTAPTAAEIRSHFHSWTAHSAAVLTDTGTGLLRSNLSEEDAGALGSEYAAWKSIIASLEDPAAPFSPAPLPAYGASPVRRRYRMGPGVAPVLSYFLLTFNVRTTGGSSAVKPIESRMRWMMTYWNPYTSAYVPENLRAEVTGLPTAVQVFDETAGGAIASFSLQDLYGSPLRIGLPWDASAPEPERQSWLPGRTYTWTALENLTGVPPTGGFPSRFNSRNLSADGGQGVQKQASSVTVDGDDVCHLTVAQPQSLVIRLYAVRAGGDVLLATFRPGAFSAFTTTPRKLSAGTYQFSYLFRLFESFDTPAAPGTWLTTAGLDLRSPDLPAAAFVFGANGNRPELYENYVTISSPDRLLDRAGGALSYNEDVPVFELPRSPLLSLAGLQHLRLDGSRPFAVGNPWGGGAQLGGVPANAIFDRYKVASAAGTGGLAAGAFNINSLEPEAWAAVLRGARFQPAEPFSFLDAAAGTGTAADTALAQLPLSGAAFFRFAQTAQETAKADPPTTNANTNLFRRGLRELDEPSIQALAAAIAQRNAARRAAAGPWRSLREFLDESPITGAIADCGLNASVEEFSSQWLTAADVVGPLAPFLFARSDRFVIRAYGHVTAPLTGEVRGRAWLEAEVQRFPEYVDVTDNPAHPLGRRFRIVSFRWLSPADI